MVGGNINAMKYLLIILLLLTFRMTCYTQVHQNDSSAYVSGDSLTTVDYFPPEPKVIYEPKIVTPKDLQSIIEKVRVIVKMKLDSTNKGSSYHVAKSSNPKFNKVAIKYAKMYKFEYPKSDEKKYSMWIAIPIIFNK